MFDRIVLPNEDYPRLSAARLIFEFELASEICGDLRIVLTRKGRIEMSGSFLNQRGTSHTFRIELPFTYPEGRRMPKVFVSPKPWHHVHIDGSVCMRMKGTWSESNNLSQIVLAVAKLCKGL